MPSQDARWYSLIPKRPEGKTRDHRKKAVQWGSAFPPLPRRANRDGGGGERSGRWAVGESRMRGTLDQGECERGAGQRGAQKLGGRAGRQAIHTAAAARPAGAVFRVTFDTGDGQGADFYRTVSPLSPRPFPTHNRAPAGATKAIYAEVRRFQLEIRA